MGEGSDGSWRRKRWEREVMGVGGGRDRRRRRWKGEKVMIESVIM